MSELTQGLLITAIGMGLVFAVIIFLWGLMALIMRLTSNNKKVEEITDEEPQIEIAAVSDNEGFLRKHHAATAAAAAAVAVELARMRHKKITSQRVSDNFQGGLTPWQTAHRLRQMEIKKR